MGIRRYGWVLATSFLVPAARADSHKWEVHAGASAADLSLVLGAHASVAVTLDDKYKWSIVGDLRQHWYEVGDNTAEEEEYSAMIGARRTYRWGTRAMWFWQGVAGLTYTRRDLEHAAEFALAPGVGVDLALDHNRRWMLRSQADWVIRDSPHSKDAYGRYSAGVAWRFGH
jgi:hypothetical protein